MTKHLMAAVVVASLLFVPAMAKNKVTTHQVHFAKGTTGSTIKGHVKGYDTVNYKLGAKAGQSMGVGLKSKKAFFTIIAPGKEVIFNGTIKGNSYLDTLPTSGTYTIQVYLMRNEARRGTNAPYTLEIGID
jgi:hypothetical protein